MKLSERLKMVVSFVKEGSGVADVGTDHGYVPITLAEAGTVRHALAMDVRPGPLERAKTHISRHRLEDVIETRLSDGVRELKEGEADTVIIAGMGGELVIHILDDGKRLWNQVEHWILSPQSELDKVREYLSVNGFAIAREEMLEEEGKYYTVMDVVRGEMKNLKPWESLYGPCLIRDRHPVLKEFLDKEERLLKKIWEGLTDQEGEGARKRAQELKIQIEWIQEAKREL